MNSRLLSMLACASVFAAGCSTISDTFDSINPFASSGPKMAKLEPVSPTIGVRDQWSASIGKAGDYIFRPAVVDNAVFVAARNGEISKLVDGRKEWTINAGQPLSAGVGADSRLVVVATGKGDVLAFAASSAQAADPTPALALPWPIQPAAASMGAPTPGVKAFPATWQTSIPASEM